MEILKLEPLNGGDMLSGIFKYQNNLMELYMEKGMLMRLPIDMNDRASQLFLKGLIGDIIEELVEANTYYKEDILTFQVENGHQLVKGSPAFDAKTWNNLHDSLKDYSEELADLSHFLIELLIYSNIGPEDIGQYFEKVGESLFQNPLNASFNSSIRNIIANRELNDIKFAAFRMYNLSDMNDFKNDYPGVFISPDVYHVMEVLSYRIIESLKLASHKLKNKYWKQKDIATSSLEFQKQLMEAWERVIDYMVFVGMSQKRFYVAYEEKNIKNQNRLKDGY